MCFPIYFNMKIMVHIAVSTFKCYILKKNNLSLDSDILVRMIQKSKLKVAYRFQANIFMNVGFFIETKKSVSSKYINECWFF